LLVTSSRATDTAHRLFAYGNKLRMNNLEHFPPNPSYCSAPQLT
jgi:hypothetical protein